MHCTYELKPQMWRLLPVFCKREPEAQRSNLPRGTEPGFKPRSDCKVCALNDSTLLSGHSAAKALEVCHLSPSYLLPGGLNWILTYIKTRAKRTLKYHSDAVWQVLLSSHFSGL